MECVLSTVAQSRPLVPKRKTQSNRRDTVSDGSIPTYLPEVSNRTHMIIVEEEVTTFTPEQGIHPGVIKRVSKGVIKQKTKRSTNDSHGQQRP